MLSVTGLPAFNDNYIWLLCDTSSRRCYAVDPGDATPVTSFCSDSDWTLSGILLTHHHADHTGGVARLTDLNDCPVYGPASESIRGVTHPVQEGSLLHLPGCTLSVIETPGHTSGHISYFGHIQTTPVLFCGDTLFAGGCGRLFEGTPAQMLASLKRLAVLPAGTQVYCAHEYTLTNLAFARLVEPDNPHLQQRHKAAQDTRGRGEPTVPSTLQEELDTNPFLRTQHPAVRQAASRHAGSRTPGSEVEVFSAIRQWKDTF